MEITFFIARQVQNLLGVDQTMIYRVIKNGLSAGTKVEQIWRYYSCKVKIFLSDIVISGEKKFWYPIDDLLFYCLQPIRDAFTEIANLGSVATREYNRSHIKKNKLDEFCNLIVLSIVAYLWRLQTLSDDYRNDRTKLEKAAKKIPVLGDGEVTRINVWFNRVASTFDRIGEERADLMNRLRKISAMSEINI